MRTYLLELALILNFIHYMKTIIFIRITLISFILCYLLPVHAEYCETRDFNQQIGPIRNQSNVGWCFANTGADLLTYSHKEQLSKFSETQVSAIFTALNFYRAQINGGVDHDQVFNHGGFILDAINIIQNKSFVCPQSLDYLLMSTGYKTQLKEKFVQFKLFYDVYQDYRKTGSEEKKTTFFNMINSLNQQGTFLSSYDKEKIKNVLEQPTLEAATMKMVDVVCENKKIPIVNKTFFARISRQSENSFFNSQYNKMINTEEMFNNLNNVLDLNHPIGIAYNVEKVLNEPKISSGGHASVISGRKLINGQCHYQIRNSWGNDCTYNHLKKEHNIYSYACDNGTFWVPESDMRNLIDEIVFQTESGL